MRRATRHTCPRLRILRPLRRSTARPSGRRSSRSCASGSARAATRTTRSRACSCSTTCSARCRATTGNSFTAPFYLRRWGASTSCAPSKRRPPPRRRWTRRPRFARSRRNWPSASASRCAGATSGPLASLRPKGTALWQPQTPRAWVGHSSRLGCRRAAASARRRKPCLLLRPNRSATCSATWPVVGAHPRCARMRSRSRARSASASS